MHGAVFRTFRDLGASELGDTLTKALAAPATKGGRSLASVIKVLRNSFAHRTYDMQALGDAMLFWGLEYSPRGLAAWEGLMEASTTVLSVIDSRKLNLIAYFWSTGTLDALTEFIQTAPRRAVESARSKKREGHG